MLLVMHNLPPHIKYSDIKILIRNKCYIDDIILDKLVKDGTTNKKVTIGVAKEEEAMRILHRLNGTYVEGQQIFIEEVKKGSSEVSSNRNNSGMDYLTSHNRSDNNPNQSQMATGHQDNINVWNTQYGYAMPVQASGWTAGYQAQGMIQQAMKTQMMSNYTGYNAVGVYGMTNTSGIPSLLQTNLTAYGNQQGQQQWNSSQGKFGGSGTAAETPKESGHYNAHSQDRGYDSGNQKGYGSQQYAGDNDKGFGFQGSYQGGDWNDTRDYGSRNSNTRFYANTRDSRFGNQSHMGNQNERGLDSQEPWGNSRGFSREGNDRSRDVADRKRRHSPERGDRYERDRFQAQRFERDKGDKGFGGNQSRGLERNSRDKGFGGNQGRGFETDTREKGFGGNQGRGFERDSREKGFGRNQGRGFEMDVRDKSFGGNQGYERDRFQSQGLGSNQNKGFDGRGKGFGGNHGRRFESDSHAVGVGGNQGRGFQKDSRAIGLGGNQGRGFERDSREIGLGGNQGRGFERDSREKGLGVNQGRGFERDSREKGLGGNQGKSFAKNFPDKSFGGNQGKGFGRDSRDGFGGNQGMSFGAQDNYNRGGTPRECFPPKPVPKPFQPPAKPSEPWSNTSHNNPSKPPAKPFGNKPSFSNDKPFNRAEDRNDSKKPGIQWNRNPGPPLSHSSPVKTAVPAKRAKIEDTPKPRNDVAYEHDQRTANRAVSWRGQGISMIVKSILDRFVPVQDKHQHGKTAYQQSIRLLKRALNSQLDAIIKQKFPRNPYPLLQDHEIVELYRSVHPSSNDVKLYKAHFAPPEIFTVKPDKIPKSKPLTRYEPPTPMGPPKTSNVPQAKPSVTQSKPYVPPGKPVINKPTLSDLLPPAARQPLNTYPLRSKPVKKPKPVDLEKRAKQERKLLHKTEFLDQSLYKCKTPVMESALNAVLDEITNVYKSAVEEYETKDKDEQIVAQGIVDKTTAEFRWTVRLHTIKRILNVSSALMLRIFVNGGKAPKTEVERVLQPYGITYLKASKMSKTHMLMACVDSFENFDRLCTHTGVAVNGRTGTSFVTAKPLHLTIPMKFRRLLRQKKCQDMTSDEEDGDFDENEEDDDVLPAEDNDDDVVEIVKENEVIELSGDENTLQVPDDDSSEVKDNSASEKLDVSESVVSKATTVDLTAEEDFSADVTVDDKINAAISEEMGDEEMGDAVVEIDDEEIGEDDLEDY